MQTLFLRKHAQLLFACLTFAKQEFLTKLPPRPCIICVYGLPHMQPAAKIKQRPDRSQGEQKLLRNVPPGLQWQNFIFSRLRKQPGIISGSPFCLLWEPELLMLVVSFLGKCFWILYRVAQMSCFSFGVFFPCFLDEMLWDQQSYSGEMGEMEGLKQEEWVGGSDLVSYWIAEGWLKSWLLDQRSQAIPSTWLTEVLPPGTAAGVELIKQRLTASLTPLEKDSLCFPEWIKDYSVIYMGTPKHVSSHLLGRVSKSVNKPNMLLFQVWFIIDYSRGFRRSF